MKKTDECNGKYWFTCTRCLRLLVKDYVILLDLLIMIKKN